MWKLTEVLPSELIADGWTIESVSKMFDGVYLNGELVFKYNANKRSVKWVVRQIRKRKNSGSIRVACGRSSIRV